MTTSALSPTPGPREPVTRAEVATAAVARVLRQKRDEAAALIKLVEQASRSSDKGRHVSYFA